MESESAGEGSLDKIVACAADLQDALGLYLGVIKLVRAEMLAGGTRLGSLQIANAHGAREARHVVETCFRDYAQAVGATRIEFIRGLVDEESMSLSEVARSLGISRQLASRLYSDRFP